MTQANTNKKETTQTQNLPQKVQPTYSERFTGMIIREYATAASSPVQLNELQKKLAQHLFVKIDMTLTEMEIKRRKNPNKKDMPPMEWKNVELAKLASAAVHRIELGLDALIPNHIHPIPYLNGRTQKYEIDLRVGYAGKDYYHREMALTPPVNISYELVHENDELIVHKKGINNPVESYEFHIPKPFDRGEVVGGFGYIQYDDERKNQIVLLSMADFEAARKKAGNDDFWGKHPNPMRLKTIVLRTVPKIVLDPKKINQSFAIVETEDNLTRDEIEYHEAQTEAETYGNQGEIIDIKPEETKQEKQAEPEDAPY